MTAGVFIILLVLQVAVGWAQAPASVDEAVDRGWTAVTEQRWEDALIAFNEALALEAGSGPAHFGLGQALMQLDRPGEAAPHYQMAAVQNFWLPYARFRQACALARAGDREGAFVALAQATAAGFNDLDTLRSSGELAVLRGDARFAELIADAERRAKPCEFDERYRAFDFWIGDWDVYGPQGRQVGANAVQRLLSGCMLLENWTSASGTSGKSINYLDPATGRWHQHWIDESGRLIDYEGEFADGMMRFSGRLTDAEGEISLSRMTFTPRPDGSVKQFIEQSKDGGASWSVWFDGIYVRKGRPFPGAGG
jgi:tetratricopeptide (TPR) repeat protein